MDEAFDVGGAQLQFPGDPDGPAEEVCNCRCTLLPVVSEERMRHLRWEKFFRKANGVRGAAGRNGHNGNDPNNRVALMLERSRREF